MSPHRLWLGACAAALLVVATPAHAFRCGTRIITRGDPVAKLLRFCGEPVSVQARRTQRSMVLDLGRVFPGIVEEVLVEEWTYNLGPQQLMRVVRLENGVVAEVKMLGYGY